MTNLQRVLNFETLVAASPAEAWSWITSLKGISKEMAPYIHMSAPNGVEDLSSIAFVPGVPMFRSWITLFGVLPIDYSKLTLLSLNSGIGFVEQSPMGSMKLWRHERHVTPSGAGSIISDTLTFQPRFAGRLVYVIVRAFFSHRHRMLEKNLGKCV